PAAPGLFESTSAGSALIFPSRMAVTSAAMLLPRPDARMATRPRRSGIVHLPVPGQDPADPPVRLASPVEVRLEGLQLPFRHHRHHSDPEIERAPHLRVGDLARFLHPAEEGRDRPGARPDL